MSEKTTWRLVEEWQQASQSVASRRRDLEAAIRHETKCEEELAKRILPDDAKGGETFSLWVRTGRKTERIVQATRIDGMRISDPKTYRVNFRGDERPEAQPE